MAEWFNKPVALKHTARIAKNPDGNIEVAVDDAIGEARAAERAAHEVTWRERDAMAEALRLWDAWADASKQRDGTAPAVMPWREGRAALSKVGGGG